MNKPILYGIELSPPVRAVLLTAKAIQLDFEYKELDLELGEHKSEEFLEINPQHTVPTLEDDGKIIWDSHAIVTYLVDKYAKDDSLYPKDLYQRALVNQKLYFDAGILYPRLRTIFVDVMVFKKKEISKPKIDAIFEAYDFLEKFLEKNLYLVGNTITVADFCCIATISSSKGVINFDSSKYPNLNNWIQRLSELSYYEEANERGAIRHINFYFRKIKEIV